jgi:hypothetical protein
MTATASDLDSYQRSDDFFASEYTLSDQGDQVMGVLTIRYRFTLNKPREETWKHLKDFSAWMNDLDWDCVVGDAPEDTVISFGLAEEHHQRFKETYGLDGKLFRKYLTVKRNVPGHIIVHEELTPDKRQVVAYYMTILDEHDGATTVTGLMSYAPYWALKSNADKEIRAVFDANKGEVPDRWKTQYIPRLRRLVEQG